LEHRGVQRHEPAVGGVRDLSKPDSDTASPT
jgi:hypothetical protein